MKKQLLLILVVLTTYFPERTFSVCSSNSLVALIESEIEKNGPRLAATSSLERVIYDLVKSETPFVKRDSAGTIVIFGPTGLAVAISRGEIYRPLGENYPGSGLRPLTMNFTGEFERGWRSNYPLDQQLKMIKNAPDGTFTYHLGSSWVVKLDPESLRKITQKYKEIDARIGSSIYPQVQVGGSQSDYALIDWKSYKGKQVLAVYPREGGNSISVLQEVLGAANILEDNTLKKSVADLLARATGDESIGEYGMWVVHGVKGPYRSQAFTSRNFGRLSTDQPLKELHKLSQVVTEAEPGLEIGRVQFLHTHPGIGGPLSPADAEIAEFYAKTFGRDSRFEIIAVPVGNNGELVFRKVIEP